MIAAIIDSMHRCQSSSEKRAMLFAYEIASDMHIDDVM